MESFLIMYPLFTTFWFFMFGTVIGSFLNVVILRHESETALTGRSQCPRCRRTLTWYELIPIVSYVVQRGKCRGCTERISPQYPLVEFATGILFALVFLVNITALPSTSNLQLITYAQLLLELCVWSFLVVITVYDLRTKLIPDVFSYTFSGLALLLVLVSFMGNVSLTSNLQPLIWPLLAGPILFLPFYLLWRFSNGKWMGLGDGKLALGIGWFLGLAGGISAILLSFWIGAAVSLTLIAYQKIHARFVTSNLEPGTSNLTLKSEVPFGPFMVLGTLTVYLGLFSILWIIV
jgi:prepilin signal peptidase PulO-like enzyme (type II secretory pathway)